jgi:hypothetical protein
MKENRSKELKGIKFYDLGNYYRHGDSKRTLPAIKLRLHAR